MSEVDAAAARARGWLAGHGSEIEQLCLDTLLGERPVPELLGIWAAAQREDGALPASRGSAPPDAWSTAWALERLGSLGLLDHPVPERATSFLAHAQAPDGGYGEVTLAEELRIAATGRIAGLLGRTPFARPSMLRGAEQFLAQRWSVERVQGPRYSPILAYVRLLTQVPSELADEALQWCGRELERGFRQGSFGAVATARVFLHARARALPGARIEPAELVDALLAEQARDGHFPPTGDLHPVDATLEGVEALLWLR